MNFKTFFLSQLVTASYLEFLLLVQTTSSAEAAAAGDEENISFMLEIRCF